MRFKEVNFGQIGDDPPVQTSTGLIIITTIITVLVKTVVLKTVHLSTVHLNSAKIDHLFVHNDQIQITNRPQAVIPTETAFVDFYVCTVVDGPVKIVITKDHGEVAQVQIVLMTKTDV